ncbi:hypothetical protein F8388_000149 [Cannabis sativa]|uniref:Uncharacterized protein n=1 Tax=Cannabis sativa TaxID=3483 RepID=A0A7J6FMQ0_CANSA|nr:hypothetical protein F8388_000149 [Cannabis sativa]
MMSSYQLAEFTFGSQVINLFCLQSASTDFDLTGQLVWPGAMLLNDYIAHNVNLLQGCSVIELGSGVGITGILSSRFCHKFVLTDHNDEVIKASILTLDFVFQILEKNVELHASSQAELLVEKLEWGNSEQICHILEKHSSGFDLILGADIYILEFPVYLCSCIETSGVIIKANTRSTVKKLLEVRGQGECKFILAYVSRAKSMDLVVPNEAKRCGLQITEVVGTRRAVSNLEGVIFEVTL